MLIPGSRYWVYFSQEQMDHSIVDTAITSRKHKREEYKKIILLAAACVVHMVIGVVTWYHNNYFVKDPTCNWELERCSFLNRLYRGIKKDCIEQLRLSKNAFFNLCRILQETGRGGLVRTRNVLITKAVAIFLHILAHSLKYRIMQFSYCRSKETISRQFNDRCIGALDGTHISVIVSPNERPRYCNRKGDVSTNVLAVCGLFICYLGGKGLQEILEYYEMHYVIKKLEILTGTRYHLNEWIGNTPQSYKESFNICHESARNAIERSFGILKKRWSILRTLSFFDIKTQISIINACFALHNFIRGEQQADQLLEVQDFEFLSIVDEELVHQSREGVENNVTDDITTIQAIENWTRLRDTLAMNMFANYQSSNEKIASKRKVSGKNNEETRSYFTWNLEMERVLADVLRDQRNLGNKGDGGWEKSALNVIATMLSTSFDANVTSENAKNHIKLWRSWYGIVSEIPGHSGFDWDGTKHMITVENENAWNEYCTSHKSAKPFRFKDDIVDLCAKYRATGHGAEIAMDANEAMSRETNEVEFTGLGATATIDLEEPSYTTKKRLFKDD
ncbi:hypothetical protein HKD37_01G000783 [Glycine soja]